MTYKEIFNSWVNSKSLTGEEREELLSLSEEEKEKYFSPNIPTFGTAGIRNITGLGTQRLNRFTYRLIGKSYANYLKTLSDKPSILMGHDDRPGGLDACLEAATVLRQEGVEVILAPNSGALSTPIISRLIRKKNLSGGIGVTASHNPKEYNGLKFFNAIGKQLNVEEEKAFAAAFIPMEQAITLDIQVLDKSDFPCLGIEEVQGFIDELASIIPNTSLPIKQEIPFLFTSHGGTTTSWMCKLAHKMGFYKFEEYKKVGSESINPEEPKSFKEIIAEADRRNIEYVLAADLDGDRAAIAERQADGSWYFFNGNETGTMMAHFKGKYQDHKTAYIVSTYVTSTLIGQLFPNIPIYLTETGFKNITEAVQQQESKGKNLLIAFEEACGSLLNPVHREKDSYQQIGYLLEVVANAKSQNKKLTGYLEELRKTPIGFWRGLTNYYLVAREHIGKFRSKELAQKILSDTSISLIEIKDEGKIIVWTVGNQGWIKFRYSGTEPKLKIYYNLYGKDSRELDESITKIRGRFDDLFRSLGGI